MAYLFVVRASVEAKFVMVLRTGIGGVKKRGACNADCTRGDKFGCEPIFFGGTHQEEVRRLFEFPSRRFDESLR